MLLTAEDIEKLSENLNAFEKFMDTLPEKALSLGVRAVLAVIFFLIGVKVISFIRKVVKKSLGRAGAETGVIQFLDALIKMSLYVVLVLTIAASFGVDAASITALLGSVGVTVGLALQGSLSNLAGGILILILKPFQVGDYIVENSDKNEGTVKEIGIFYTKLQTYDNRVVVLPNGNLANNSLTNYSVSPTRRIDLTVSVSYQADPAKVRRVLQKVADDDPGVRHCDPVTICVDSLGSSGIVMGVKCYCDNAQYWETRWSLNEQIKLALDAAGIAIPYQQVDVHVVK